MVQGLRRVDSGRFFRLQGFRALGFQVLQHQRVRHGGYGCGGVVTSRRFLAAYYGETHRDCQEAVLLYNYAGPNIYCFHIVGVSSLQGFRVFQCRV